MDDWMEYWISERARELRQEAHQARLVRDLKAARRGGFHSPPYQGLLDWLVRISRVPLTTGRWPSFASGRRLRL
jgi:hypothetical protein